MSNEVSTSAPDKLQALVKELGRLRAQLQAQASNNQDRPVRFGLLEGEYASVLYEEIIRANDYTPFGWTNRVELIFPDFEKEQEIEVEYTGDRKERDLLVGRAVERTLDVIEGDAQPELKARLIDAVTKPAWERALGYIDELLVKEEHAERSKEDYRLWWHVGFDEDDALSITPLLQTKGKRGTFLKPKKVSFKSLAEDPDRLTLPSDEKVMSLLATPDLPFLPVSGSTLGLEEAALIALCGHPRVLYGPENVGPIRVQQTDVELSIVEEKEMLRIEPRVGALQFSLDELLDVLQDEEGEAQVSLQFDEAHNTLWLIEASQTTFNVMGVFAQLSGSIPKSAQAELIKRLPALQSKVSVALSGTVQHRRQEAQRKLLVRITPKAEARLSIELKIKPNKKSPTFFPGEGPKEVFAEDDKGDIVALKRDLKKETADAWRFLRSALAEPEEHFSAWVWDAEQNDEVLAFLALLDKQKEVLVEWPKDKIKISRPASASDLKLKVEDRHDWFGLSGDVEVDGSRVQLALLVEAARSDRRFVQIAPDQWLAISDQLKAHLAKVASLVFETKSILKITATAADALDKLADEAKEVELCTRWEAVVEGLKRSKTMEPKPSPNLNATLRSYQTEGFQWLMRLSTWGVGGILADDMGLGKTLQSLAVLLERASEGPALIVAPTSVCFNWAREAAKFTPSLTVKSYRGPKRARQLKSLAPGDLLITSYGVILRDVETLKNIHFGTLVLDEAQAIKNANSQRAKAVFELDAGWRLGLTGTPIENHLGELWSVFRAVSPGFLGGIKQFKDRFMRPIERDGSAEASGALASTIRPFVLRRTKAKVAKDLPARTEALVDVLLSKEERQLYDSVRLAMVGELAGLAGPEEKDKARFKVLSALTRLRQLSCHPRLYDHNTKVASSKMRLFLELLDTLLEEGQRTLVFSQFTSLLKLCRDAMEAAKIDYLYLDGSTPVKKRAALVDAFQAKQAPVFLISLKAGGTGLNLTAAENVIHLDPWWNPAVEDQATDRAHRIGQKNPVTVYKLVTRGTIEEAILMLHKDKRQLVSDVLQGSGAAGGLSTQELIDLIKGPDYDEAVLEDDEASPEDDAEE